MNRKMSWTLGLNCESRILGAPNHKMLVVQNSLQNQMSREHPPAQSPGQTCETHLPSEWDQERLFVQRRF